MVVRQLEYGGGVMSLELGLYFVSVILMSIII